MRGPEAPGFFRATRRVVDVMGRRRRPVATRIVEAPEVTHLRCTVNGRSTLVLDDRGASGELVRPRQASHAARVPHLAGSSWSPSTCRWPATRAERR
jgi:hypothetical protein